MPKEVDLEALRGKIEEVLSKPNELDRLDFAYDLKKVVGVISGIAQGINAMIGTDTIRNIELDDFRDLFRDISNISLSLIEISEDIRKLVKEPNDRPAIPENPPQKEENKTIVNDELPLRKREISYVS